MAIKRWDPFRDLMTLKDRMDRIFEDTFRTQGEEKELMPSTWSPSVDIFEDESNVVLSIELPGIEEKNIDVNIEDNALTVKGERNIEKEDKKENYHRIERAYGSFYRSFSIPNYVDVDKIEAQHENGVLKITMPKKAESKPRKVKVLKGKKGKESKEKESK
ncbi:Hsp20/alpha crystallin family protein [bacterium]|nr:Hsp20/alpha crystallin family protein [bacterium]